jgi:hypothetical protein
MLIMPTLEQEKSSSKISTPIINHRAKVNDIEQKVIVDHIEKFSLYKNNNQIQKLKSHQVKIESKNLIAI